jgi:MFS superfamily sulfate permease-like transporter
MVSVPERALHIAEWFAFPDATALGRWHVWKLAFTLFAVASLETLLSVRAVDKLDAHRRITPLNRELLAQGVGNLLSGFIGGLPVSSVIVRSTVNVAAGATSKRAVVIHGGLLAICCVFLGRYLNHVPLAVLAAVLIYVGAKLISPTVIRQQIAAGADQLVPFVITVSAILALDMLRGILIGLITGITFMLKANFRTAISVTSDGRNYLIRLRKDVSFLNKPRLSEILQGLPHGGDIIIDLTRADFIDRDIIELLAEFAREAPLKNIRVEIQANNERADVRERLRALMLIGIERSKEQT